MERRGHPRDPIPQHPDYDYVPCRAAPRRLHLTRQALHGSCHLSE